MTNKNTLRKKHEKAQKRIILLLISIPLLIVLMFAVFFCLALTI